MFNINKTDSYVSKYPNTIVDKTATSRNWLWQTEQDSEGNPVIAMVQINSAKTSHDYYHVKWTGSEWKKSFLINGGGHFHQSAGLELCYSGGMALDDSNPNIVYCSAPVKGDNGSVYEILKFEVDDKGVVSAPEYISKNSKKNNARPSLIPYSANSPLRLSLMNGEYYDWIVSNSRPKGYPTAIHCDYDFPTENVSIEEGLLVNISFDESKYSEQLVKDGIAVFTGTNTIDIETPELKEFTLSISPYIFNNSYEGKLFTFGNISWNLDQETLKPYILISDKRFNSSNLLGS